MNTRPQNAVVRKPTHMCAHNTTMHGCSCPIGRAHTLSEWLGSLPTETKPV